MEGPRPPHPGEYASLERLVDSVFKPDEPGGMFRHFQPLFNPDNRENLLVAVDAGEVVSHVGMTLRWAVIEGCTVRVACMGAVATYEQYRGQGLASRLFRAACERARADGVDFMMISGDRPMYLAAGATFVGRDRRAFVDAETAEALSLPDLRVDPVRTDDLEACKALYNTKPTRFVRPDDDWEWFFAEPDVDGRPTAWSVVRRRGAVCAYLLHGASLEPNLYRVVEWAGDASSIAAALKPLRDASGAARVRVHLQRGDDVLVGLLEAAGAEMTLSPSWGTFLLIDFEGFMRKLRPLFEARLGIRAAARLSFERNGERFRFQLGSEVHEAEGLTQTTRLIFGHPEENPPTDFLGRLFPVPALWYGSNFV
jgi:predicted N-acetyltransferase YhbS